MSVNDTICKLAQLLGLKDTQEGTVVKKRTSVAETVRLNEERLEHIKDEMTDIDNQLRMRKEEYQNASPSIRLVVKSQIMILKNDRDNIVNRLGVISSRIESGKLLLHKFDLLLFAIKNPAAIDDMEDVRDELDGWTQDLQQEQRVGGKLAEAGKISTPGLGFGEDIDEGSGDYAKAVKEDDSEFNAFLASI